MKCVYCGKTIDNLVKIHYKNTNNREFCSNKCVRMYKIILGRNEFQTPLEDTIIIN